jgi:hypothetical protein
MESLPRTGTPQHLEKQSVIIHAPVGLRLEEVTMRCPIASRSSQSMHDARTIRKHLIASVTMAATSLAAIAASNARAASIGDVFVIALENHNFTQPTSYNSTILPIDGNAAAPFINSLITPGNANATNVSYATNYTNSGTGVHPSEPNYIWSEAGTNYNPATGATITSDNDPTAGNKNIFTTPHLTGLMNAAGVTWKSYQEDYQISGKGATVSANGTLAGGAKNPYNGSTLYNYAAKHDPMAFFSDTAAENLAPLAQLTTDLTNNTVGQYNWITPDLYNDMHTALSGGFTYHGVHYTGDQAAVAQGDNFLSIVIPQIEASAAFQNNGMIVIWNDETEGGDTTAYTSTEIVISPLAVGNAYASSVPMNHSSDLKTMQEIFGLGPTYLNNAIPTSEYSPATGAGTYNSVSASNDLSSLLKPGTLFPFPQSATWVAGRTGAWSTAANWLGNVSPNNAGTQSYQVTINSGTANLDLDVTINSLALNGGTLAGNGNLTLTGGTISGSFNVTGITTLAADPITNTPVGTLTFATGTHNAGAFAGNGNLTINAGAALTSDQIVANQLSISGSLVIRSNASTANATLVHSLIVAGSSGAWTGSLDITNNRLVVQAPDTATKASDIATLQNQIQSDGQGASLGITSTGIPANQRIAVIDNAALATPFTIFGGIAVDANSILLADELLGDANADGRVDLSDLKIVLNNLGSVTSAWTSGNFDGAPTIDLTDLNEVLNSLGTATPGVNPVAAAPEPGSIAALALAAALLSGRRRRTATKRSG